MNIYGQNKGIVFQAEKQILELAKEYSHKKYSRKLWMLQIYMSGTYIYRYPKGI